MTLGWRTGKRSASRSRKPRSLVLGKPVGERLGLPEGSRVLVRRAVRYSGPAEGDVVGETADSLADEYYPYDLVRDTPLASPTPADAVEVLAGLGHRLRGYVDEIRPRLATTEERRVLGSAAGFGRA